jgi:hypothetical protein
MKLSVRYSEHSLLYMEEINELVRVKAAFLICLNFALINSSGYCHIAVEGKRIT